MEHVHHLLKFVQHLINKLSCSSLETAVYSCGDRVPMVLWGHLLQQERVSPGWRGHSCTNVKSCLLLSPSQDNLYSWFGDRPENSAKEYSSSPASAVSICTPARLLYICSANWAHLQILFLWHILLSCRSWANEIKDSDRSRFHLYAKLCEIGNNQCLNWGLPRGLNQLTTRPVKLRAMLKKIQQW